MKEENTEKNSAPCASLSPAEISRRKFLARFSIAIGGIGAFILSVPVAGYVLAPFFETKPQAWRSVGKVDSFKVGDTVAVTYEDTAALPWAGVTSKSAAWLRRADEENFIAFAVNCTHLGCPVRWLSEASLFMCPCHGGVYYKDGTVAAGPPPKPLTRYPVRIKDGEVQIQTTPLEVA